MSEPFIGQIMQVGFNFAPRGWALCDGQILSIAQNQALFSLLGTVYGGDGRTTFALPDLRGRSMVHVGTGPGLAPVSWGERAGQENITLNVNNMPAHTHAASVTNGLSLGVTTESANTDDPDGSILSAGPDLYSSVAPDASLNSAALQGTIDVTNANAGGGQAFNSRNPFLGVYHIIALTGIFPSRSFLPSPLQSPASRPAR